jgi:hypothetical protein
MLTESKELRAGWWLVLPWDAAGNGVQYGLLPTAQPAPAVQRPGGQGPAPASSFAGSPPFALAPTTPDKRPKPSQSSQCTSTAPSRKDSGWARQRVGADRAWSRTQGEGVLVAVVDSGVNGSVPELTGRVAVGADIPSGSGRGDADCLGSGTAMASIIAAQAGSPAQGNQMVGMAPRAVILPLRVVDNVPQSRPTDVATAIEVAVSAGTRVVALGSYVDFSDPVVLAKIKVALAHDVVVVAPALTSTGSTASPPPGLDGMIWVAGVGPDGQPAADYRPGAVDVIAPGIDVASIGVNGTGVASSGSQYAVAFAAGAATLVRSAFPNLNATQVVHRLKVTADHSAGTVPAPDTGWGMINSGAAVTMVLAGEGQAVGVSGKGPSAVRTLTIALLIVVGLAAVAVLAWRSRARFRANQGDPDGSTRQLWS